MLRLTESLFLISCFFLLTYTFSYYYTYYYKNNSINKNFMGFIFIFFGLLKLYDLNKFVNIFSKYDIISKKFPFYAFLYPFIEIFIGLLMIKNLEFDKVNYMNIILMLVSIISVSFSILNGQNLRCGCLGSFFHIPLSYVTLSENFIMLFMGINLLK